MGGDRTNAERQRRYIARLKAQAAKAGVTNAPVGAIMKGLHPEQRKHLTRAELDAVLDDGCKAFTAWLDSLKLDANRPVTKPVTKPADSDAAALVQELAHRLEAENVRLMHENTELMRENAELRERLEQAAANLRKLEARIIEAEQAKARIAELEARGEQPQASADAEIAALRDENYAFRVELEARNRVFKTRAGGGLTNAQYRMLLKVYHPDNPASEKTRNECLRLINQLRYVLCNEAELPSMDPKKYSTSAQQLWHRRQQEIKEAKKHTKRRAQPKASPRPPRNLPKA
jgi:hypothetical protein